MATFTFLDADEVEQSIDLPDVLGRLAAAGSRAVVLSTEDLAVLTAIKESQEAIQADDSAAPVTVPPAESTSTVTIASGASLSGGIQVDGKFVGLSFPAAWTAAGLEFQGSENGTDYHDIYYAGAKYAVAAAGVAASVYVAVDPLVFLGVNYVKIRSATAGSAVNQGADRVLTPRVTG